MCSSDLEAQHHHAFALNPMLPRIRKLLSTHGNHGLISDRCKRLEGFDDIVRIGLNDPTHIVSRTYLPMRVDSKSTRH